MADWIEHWACFADHRLACGLEDARIWDGDTEDTDYCGATETCDEGGWSPGVRGSDASAKERNHPALASFKALVANGRRQWLSALSRIGRVG